MPLQPDDVKVAITLSSIAYLDEDADPLQRARKIDDMVKNEELPTGKKGWKLAWGPYTDGSNLMYVVRGPVAPRGGYRYGVAVRGTVMTSLLSVGEDLELTLVPLPWAREGAAISKGILQGFDNLIAMKDDRGQNVVQFLRERSDMTELLVTGHSQGGCLATVLALYLRSQLGQASVLPVPFAGQTAGNAAFAGAYTDAFGDQARWFNRWDIIPRWWNYDTLGQILELYPGDAPKADAIAQGFVREAREKVGHNYFQPGGGTTLPGQIYLAKPGPFGFLKEVEAQHNSNYYMYLAGISKDVIKETVGPGWEGPPPTA